MDFLKSRLSNDILFVIKRFVFPSPEQVMEKVFIEIYRLYDEAKQEKNEEFKSFIDHDLDEDDQLDDVLYERHFNMYCSDEDIIEYYLDIVVRKYRFNTRRIRGHYLYKS